MEELNVGTVDRILRVVLGLVFVYTSLYVTLSVTMIWALAIAGLILIVTAISGICPVYLTLRLCKAKKG